MSEFGNYVIEEIKYNDDLYNKLVLTLIANGHHKPNEEDYERVMNQLTAEQREILEQFGPEDATMTAQFIACLPEYRQKFEAASLYRIFLESRGKKGNEITRPGSSPNNEDEQNKNSKGGIFSRGLEELLEIAPKDFFTSKQADIEVGRLNVLKRCYKETFALFEESPKLSLEVLTDKISREEKENTREAYKAVKKHYKAYLEFEVENINPQFEHPRTKEIGVLPSLHQRIGIYHILKEKRFGIFDDCGTGKTAQAAIAAKMLQKKLSDIGKKVYNRTIVLCPNSAKEAWGRGLEGHDAQRYFDKKQKTLIFNGNNKNFEEEVGDKEWLILNYEKLITKVNYQDKTMTMAEALAKIGFDTLIVDELHNLKSTNENAVIAPAARYLALQLDEDNDHKPFIGLTGTPIPDNMKDYSMLAHLLEPEKYPEPIDFEVFYKENPRVIASVMNQKTLRRKSEDVTKLEELKREYVKVDMGDVQRLIYEGIIGNKGKYKTWLWQARKALLDPRLVDPEILEDLGFLGEIDAEDAAKYHTLEKEIIKSIKDGENLGRDHKFVVFSSMLADGVTRYPKHLEKKYEKIGKKEYFDKLGFNKKRNISSLKERLEKKLLKEFGKPYKIGIIDGEVSPDAKKGKLSDRDKVLKSFREDPLHIGTICTTETASESLDMTNANYAFFLDEDYSPVSSDQAEKRLHRTGQDREVHIRYLSCKDSLDESIEKYVQRKRFIIQIAVDGYELTEEEKEIIEDKSRLKELHKNMGGQSQDLSLFNFDEDSICTRVVKPTKRKSKGEISGNDYDITNGQLLRRMIAPFVNRGVGWNDPKLVNLYVNTIKELSIYALHRARVLHLLDLAKKEEIIFPEKILAEGSGPSLLYDAVKDLEKIIKNANILMPKVVDRDLAKNMLAAGNNPNQITGDMRGYNSIIGDKEFNLVDHESISLLRYSGDIKDAVLETHRILKDEGYVLFGAKDIQFADSFYEGLGHAGFNVLSEKNAELYVNDKFLQKLGETLSEEYIQKFRNRLLGSHFLLAQKIDAPVTNLNSDYFVLERSRSVKEEPTPKEFEESIPENFKEANEVVLSRSKTKETKYSVNNSGNLQPINGVIERGYEKRPTQGKIYTVGHDGTVRFQ